MNNIQTSTIITQYKKYKLYHLHNSFHLGDSVFNMCLFKNIELYLIRHNIKIIYYTNESYLKQLNEFINIKNIKLKNINTKPSYSVELWINNHYFRPCHDEQNIPCDYNNFYKKFFNDVLIKLGFPFQIKFLYYWDKELIYRYKKLPKKYHNIDILFINSTPLSGQFNYDKNKWDDYIRVFSNINSHLKVITTTKIDNLNNCTIDDNLTVKDIAAISMKTKVIVAINSGVVPGILNYYTLTHVKHVYIFDDRCYYSYPNFENRQKINDIKYEELLKYIYS